MMNGRLDISLQLVSALLPSLGFISLGFTTAALKACGKMAVCVAECSHHLIAFTTPWGLLSGYEFCLVCLMPLQPSRGVWKRCWIICEMSAAYLIWMTFFATHIVWGSRGGITQSVSSFTTSGYEATTWKMWNVQVSVLTPKIWRLYGLWSPKHHKL